MQAVAGTPPQATQDSASFSLLNRGTAAVYYSWIRRKVEQPVGEGVREGGGGEGH